ncbi:cytochrome P450 CYP72A219 [Cinnamomum micranthum f. kanehirae]|uniref:Cytochrome P450 CYP72A219 n=1 Tax=Cinnamomum micranthum f. kanehirae TaxID=337451 RepID=A0A3S3NZD3_9MAGN|nr:cytochrome P450 CYP72A219 [Cinnamomum micranthum f. kanehirae]
MLPGFSTSCIEMVKKWEMLIGSKESYELDVWPELQNLTADVSMVLYEALRLYSGVILVRQTNKRVKLGNFSFAPGVQLALPMLLIQRDPELWGDDADEFKPERFSGGLSNASKHQMASLPFGGGAKDLSWPKLCIDGS